MSKNSGESDEPEGGGGRERRQYSRTHLIWTGSLAFGDRSVDCVIMNASANGAKIRVAEALPFPEIVTLRIPRLGGFRAEVVWSRDNKLGVRFLEEPERVAELIEHVLPQPEHAS